MAKHIKSSFFFLYAWSICAYINLYKHAQLCHYNFEVDYPVIHYTVCGLCLGEYISNNAVYNRKSPEKCSTLGEKEKISEVSGREDSEVCFYTFRVMMCF